MVDGKYNSEYFIREVLWHDKGLTAWQVVDRLFEIENYPLSITTVEKYLRKMTREGELEREFKEAPKDFAYALEEKRPKVYYYKLKSEIRK